MNMPQYFLIWQYESLNFKFLLILIPASPHP